MSKEKNTIDTPHVAVTKQQRKERITRIIAIIVAFLSVFFFFIKLVFL